MVVRAEAPAADLFGAVFLFDFLQAGGHEIQGFIPGGFLEFATFLFAEQRGLQAIRMLHKAHAEAALDAEPAFVGQGLGAHGLDDLAALDVQVDLAADPAVGAGGADVAAFPGAALVHGVFVQQGPHGAGLHAFAAEDAVGIDIRIIRLGHDLVVVRPGSRC